MRYGQGCGQNQRDPGDDVQGAYFTAIYLCRRRRSSRVPRPFERTRPAHPTAWCAPHDCRNAEAWA
eukprot:77431-Hanusia_phi.AAC.2